MDENSLIKPEEHYYKASGKRLDFVSFKERIKRLVENLLQYRPKNKKTTGIFSLFTSEDERVEIELEQDKIKVKFYTLETLSFDLIAKILELFQKNTVAAMHLCFAMSI